MKHTLRLLLLHMLALLARPFVRAPRPALTRILYIKPDHLGDLLLATPVLAALRAQQPAAQITALIGPWSQAVLARNPDVDVLLTCPFPGFERKQATGNRKQGIGQRLARFQVPYSLSPYLTLLKYTLLLRAGRYDAALIGRDDHWWGAALALLAGIPLRLGYAVPECAPFLSVALAWDARAHVTQQGLRLVQSLNKQTGAMKAAVLTHQSPITNYHARFDPAPADLAWADRWLAAHGITPTDRLVIIHPGTAGPTKHWLPERWAAVAMTLTTDGRPPTTDDRRPTDRTAVAATSPRLPPPASRAKLVLTGGPAEAALVAQVAAQITPRPLTLAGQTTLGQLAALLRRATLVLGVDSGPLHLAAAQGVPTVHCYGPSDATRFGPWGAAERHRIVSAGVACSPCGVFAACPRGLAQPECMERIGADDVIAASLVISNW